MIQKNDNGVYTDQFYMGLRGLHDAQYGRAQHASLGREYLAKAPSPRLGSDYLERAQSLMQPSTSRSAYDKNNAIDRRPYRLEQERSYKPLADEQEKRKPYGLN